jgi:hypothetical protein
LGPTERSPMRWNGSTVWRLPATMRTIVRRAMGMSRGSVLPPGVWWQRLVRLHLSCSRCG